MKENRGIPPKATLTIRLLIGCYLLYIDYQIFPDVMAREGVSKYVMLAIMVFFAITGIALIIFSAKALPGAGESGSKKEYRPAEGIDAADTGNESSSDTVKEPEENRVE